MYCITCSDNGSQERRFACRGAINAVPENYPAYKPYGQRCGALRPNGRAPRSASVVNALIRTPGASTG